MHLVGRYHRVRPIGPNGIGAPYVWDRGRAQDAPRMIPAPYDRGERFKGFTRYGEWWRSPEGIWTPVLAGGAGGTYFQGLETLAPTLYSAGVSSTLATLALDSAYANAASGDAVAGRFTLPLDDTLASVYLFISSFTGTAANVNDLDFELRNDSTTTGPSTTLHEGQTLNPGSLVGWNVKTGWTFSLVAGTRYWIVVGDADGNGTDFATVLRSTGMASGANDNVYQAQHSAWQTTDGWASVRTAAGLRSSLVLKLGSGRMLGNPFTALANSTSNQNRRGLRFIAPATCKLFGLAGFGSVAVTTLTGIELWSGSSGPSGTPAATGSIRIAARVNLTDTVSGYAFATSPTVTQGTAYRLVCTYAVNSAIPQKLSIGTGADASLRSAVAGGGAWYWAGASGTTDWSNDDISAFPSVEVALEDFVTESAGGGGGLRMAGHGGLAA